MTAALTLCQREIVRFLRQRSRIIGAVLPPLIFWFLIGSGMGGSFRHQDNLNYLQYFFPGMIIMVVLFTAIFSTISIIEDRKEGFLQSVLVAPVPRSSIALGKISGGACLAFGQALVFLVLAPMVGVPFRPGHLLFVLLILLASSFGLTGLGFLIAWKMNSTQGFHAIMNLFLMPMWFLSGALFPVETAPVWLERVMMANPLMYSVTALRDGFYSADFGASGPFPSPSACAGVALVFAFLMFAASVWMVSRPEKGGMGEPQKNLA